MEFAEHYLGIGCMRGDFACNQIARSASTLPILPRKLVTSQFFGHLVLKTSTSNPVETSCERASTELTQPCANLAAGMASQQEKALKEKDIKPGDYVATRIGSGEALHCVL